jgi:hypothetical protein
MNRQANTSAKSKELQATAQAYPNAAYLLLLQSHNKQSNLIDKN